jgi:hypothetical protein
MIVRDLVVGASQGVDRPSTSFTKLSMLSSCGLDWRIRPRITPRMLRTRWFSSAMSSSWRSLAVWRSRVASSAMRSTTSIRVARSVSATRISEVVNGRACPSTSSFHSAKLSRGVSRGPFGP